MSAVASLLALALAIAVATAGAQKVVFNPVSSRIADDLGYSKRVFQGFGVVELIAAVLVVIGLKASVGSLLGISNVIGAALIAVVAVVELLARRSMGKGWRVYAYTAAVLVAALAEVVFRAVQ